MSFERMIQHAGNTEIFKKIQAASHLPTPPAVAVEMIRAANDPNTNFETIAELLAKDPGLAAKVMQLANSALYRRVYPVSSLIQAVSVLGLKTTCTVAGGIAIAGALRHLQCRGIDLKLLWKRSLTAAAFARRVSPHTLIADHDALFLGALLQDIGMYVLCSVDPEFYAEFPDATQQTHTVLSIYEQERLNVDHAEVGAYLLHLWNLPTPIVSSVAGSHDVSSLFVQPGESLYALITRAAGLAAELWINPNPHVALVSAASELVSHTEMNKTQLVKTIEGIEDEVLDLAATFNIDITDADTLVARAVQETLAFFQDHGVPNPQG